MSARVCVGYKKPRKRCVSKQVRKDTHMTGNPKQQGSERTLTDDK